MARSPRTIEIEWQLVVRDPEAVRRWLARARFADGWTLAPRAVERLRDAYFDSAEWDLARAGYALRLRRRPTAVEATLKATVRGRAGMARRREITQPLADARSATLLRSRGAVARRLTRLLGDRRLRRLFALRTYRRRWALARDRRVVAEIALDRTLIVSPQGRSRRLSRLEIEVEAGTPRAIAAFVATVRRAQHLTVARRSKFEEGLAVAALVPPRRR